jgi:biotin carboxylase
MPNVIVINPYNRFPNSPRWDFELIEYDKFIDHNKFDVTYIVDERGESGLPQEASRYKKVSVDNLSDLQALQSTLEGVIAQLGEVYRVISFSEGHMDMLAQLREHHNIPGPKVAETQRARDKLVMKEVITGAGLRAPYFIAINHSSRDEIDAFVNTVGFPIILKPTDGASSVGVQKLDSLVCLEQALNELEQGNWELEEYVAGEVLHIDGLIDLHGKVCVSIPSVYINTLFEYLSGVPTGSYLLPPHTSRYENIKNFSEQCLTALDFKGCPFHLELIEKADGELVFLENAARVAGADIPYMIADCMGINLFEQWVAMIFDKQPELPTEEFNYGAWLLFGLPPQLPCTVKDVSSFIDSVPTLYKELIPPVGSQVDKGRGYCSLQAGRFMFKGEQLEDVQRDVQLVLDNFDIQIC